MELTRVHVLLVDPGRRFALEFGGVLRGEGYRVTGVRSVEAAMEAAARDVPNVVIKPAIETAGPGSSGVMERLQGICMDTQFIFVSAEANVRMAMDAVRRGAFDCLPLPCAREQLVESVRRAIEQQVVLAENPEILKRLRGSLRPNILTGESPKIRAIQEIIERVADTDVTVLIQGESGTGKELVARLLHERSGRSQGPFVAVNCAALPDTILESEFFGHVRGAFTGAVADKPGRFALARGGTLFLDEIADLSPLGQADLLRVLEDGIYRPVGSAKTVRADARIIAATNRFLEDACRSGSFREDLLYRLNVIMITLPTLRERPEDIVRLAASFVAHFCARHRRPPKRVSPRLEERLRVFPWPGNVRQLRNAIERMVLLTPARLLLPEHLPGHLEPAPPSDSTPPLAEMTLARAEDVLIRQALDRCHGNKAAAARHLGISRRTLHYKLKRFSRACT
jgi:DNA-binding NtrC family response regulator